MKKYFPELDTISDILATIPHPQIQSIAHTICMCNDQDTETFKVFVATNPILQKERATMTQQVADDNGSTIDEMY